MKVAYWNLGGATNSSAALSELLAVESPDICCVAEYPNATGHIYPGYTFQKHSTRLALVIRSQHGAILKHPVPTELSPFFALTEILGFRIAMCHVKSLLNDGQDERDHHLREISVVLRKAINPWERLLVIGDMNANPWDRAMVSRRGLHGHQTAVEASQPSTHYKQDYPRLLNLTYQLAKPLAVSGSEVWGTFKHKEKKLDGTLRWHLLDQALVSADLAHAAVRSMTGTTSKPWHDGLGISGKRRTWPDHLPILVEF